MFGKMTKMFDTKRVEVEITTNTAPASFPTTTDEIDGVENGYTIAPGSSVYATDSGRVWILNDLGVWTERT